MRIRPRSRNRLALALALAVVALLACAHTGGAHAEAATVVDSAGAVEPCALPQSGEPQPRRPAEPGFCHDRRERRDASKRRLSSARQQPLGRAPAPRSDEDEFSALGGGSPFCDRPLAGAAARNCRSSGALAHPYPIGNYGLDVHIDTGVTRITSNLMMALQTLASLCWVGLLYLIKGVLLLLEWAFSFDLLGDALADVRRAMVRLHQSVLGEPWLMFAIAAAGLWGIWRGFVQRRTIETISGLAATVALMVVALLLIQNPAQTVGEASRLTNEAALGLLAGASTGSVAGGERAFAAATTRVFDSLVLRPWCALQFADVRFCLAAPPGDIPDDLADEARASRSVADLWLRFPAGGRERNALYEAWRGDGNPLQPKVRLQKEGQTATRIALVLLIAIGLLGAICLLGWLGVKLLFQAVMALLLLLAAPAMLLAPAFGESGRAIFLGWAKRLLAAVVAKAIFALLLAIVLVAAGLLAEFESLGFIGLWLLQIVFWWGLFLKRGELIGWLAVSGLRGAEGHRRGGVLRRAREAALGLHLARSTTGALAAPGRALTRLRGEHTDLKRVGTQAAAQETLRGHADTALSGQLGSARATLDRERQLDEELLHTDRFLSKYDKQVQLAKAKGERPPSTGPDERAMLARREALRESKAPDPVLRQARSIVGAADRNRALEGREFTDRDRDRLIAQRRRDLEAGLPAEHERNLRFAGIDPDEHFRADPAERARLEQRSRQAIERDQQLLAALPEDGRAQPTARELAGARIEVPAEQVRDRVRRERAARQGERRQRQRRHNVYRRR